MNSCIFIGRLTRDPETRVTQSGISVARFTIAVDRRVKQDGKPTADFFRIEAWRGTAEFADKYFRKGMRVAARGEMHTEEYTDKEGVKRTAYTLTADSLEFADGKQGAPAQGNTDGFADASDFDDSEIPFA